MQSLRWLDARFEPIVLTVLMALMTVLIFLQVIMRYVFENSLVWSEELVRWVFIWTIWVGVAHAFRTGDHIRITILPDRLPMQLRLRLEQLLRIAMIAFFVWLFWLGFKQAASPIVMRQSSVVMYWPLTGQKVGLVWLYATLPFGALLSVCRLAQGLVPGAPLSRPTMEV